MKILFIFPRPEAYNSRTVREKPCGGTEKTVIFLGEAFQRLGHSVTWITSLDELRQPHERPDVVITQHAEFLENYPDARKVFWSHHFSDQPLTQQQAAYVRCFADVAVTLSQCHHDDLRDKLKLQSVVIGHGVWLEEVRKGPKLACNGDGQEVDLLAKDPFRLIYASTPFRGLAKIPELFRRIKLQEPRATISICSSMATYGEGEQDAQYQKIFDELAAIPGVALQGALNQAQLYAEYARASIFFYPCTWRETYCLAMDEAIAHCCTLVTTPPGALAERNINATHNLAGLALYIMDKFSAEMSHPDPRNVRFAVKDWLNVAKEWERTVLE